MAEQHDQNREQAGAAGERDFASDAAAKPESRRAEGPSFADHPEAALGVEGGRIPLVDTGGVLDDAAGPPPEMAPNEIQRAGATERDQPGQRGIDPDISDLTARNAAGLRRPED